MSIHKLGYKKKSVSPDRHHFFFPDSIVFQQQKYWMVIGMSLPKNLNNKVKSDLMMPKTVEKNHTLGGMGLKMAPGVLQTGPRRLISFWSVYRPSKIRNTRFMPIPFSIHLRMFLPRLFLEVTKTISSATRASFFNFWVRSFGLPAIFSIRPPYRSTTYAITLRVTCHERGVCTRGGILPVWAEVNPPQTDEHPPYKGRSLMQRHPLQLEALEHPNRPSLIFFEYKDIAKIR